MQTSASNITARNATLLVSYVWNHPSNRHHRLRAVGRAAAWQLYKRFIGRYWDVHLTNSRILRCHPNNTSASSVLYAGLFDYHEMLFLLRYLRPQDNFLDVGANVGVYTVLASSVINRGTIHAVEPSSQARTYLEENIQINNLHNVHVHPVALCDTTGKVFLTLAKDSLNHLTVDDGSEEVEEARSVRLDDEVGTIAFAAGKMDIEGAELLAMRGATQMLKKQNPPVWLLEMTSLCERFRYTRNDLIQFMRGLGYSLAVYDAEQNRLLTTAELPNNKQNVLMVSDSCEKSVRERINGQRKL